MKVLYLCDRKSCKHCSYPECKHTRRLKHAINYTRRPTNDFIKNNFDEVIHDIFFEKNLDS